MRMSKAHYANTDFRAAHAAIVKQHWLNGNTRDPVDKARAEDAVLWLYHFSGLDKPKITWVPSWPEMVSHWLVDAQCTVAPAKLAEMNWYADYRDFNPLSAWHTPDEVCLSSGIARCVENLRCVLSEFCGDELLTNDSPCAELVNAEFADQFQRANIAAIERTLLRRHVSYLKGYRDAVWDPWFWPRAMAMRGPIVASHWICPITPDFLCAALAFQESFAQTATGVTANELRKLHMVNEICLASHAAALCDRHAILCERPVQTEMQKDGGPRLVYADGWKIWEFQRIPMPRQVVDAPGEIPMERVAKESDKEIRFSMMHVLKGDSRALLDLMP